MTSAARYKVVRVIARLNVGGPARQAILLHEQLQRCGFDTVLVHGEVGPGEASLESLLADRGLASDKLPDLGARIHALSDVKAFCAVLRLLFADRPDVVHTHTAKAGALGRTAAAIYNATRRRRERCLVVHTFHGNVLRGYFGPAGSMAVRLAERALARATDCVITISPAQRDEIVGRFHVAPASRAFVVPLGLELEPLFAVAGVETALRRELGFAEHAVLFGSVGRLVPIKDLATLLRAFEQVSRSAPNTGLVIAGDGPEREKLEVLARSLPIANKVRFLGWRHDLPRLYAGLDAVVLSSQNEGTPVALIEAMAAGRPVIATAVGGVPDIIEDGTAGFLVPPADPAALAQRMVQLAQSPAQTRSGLGAAGRLAAERFRHGLLVDALSRLYREELDKLRGAGRP